MSEDGDRIEGLERLARRRAPERDLWPGIEARLAPRRRGLRPWQFALAAGVVAGLAAVFTTTLRDNGAGPQIAAPVTTAAALPLTDDSRAIVKANLALVRQAERELQQALEQNPESQSLRSLLASAEQRQRVLSARL